MPFYDEFGDSFWLTLAGLLIGAFGLSIRFCYRSKCYKIECGCLKIYRDTEDEKEIDEMIIETHGEEEDDEEKNM
jgi:hypothetical protein